MSVSDRQERIQIKDGIFMSRRRKRRNHFLGKFILLIGAVYGLILAAAVIYSTGDLKELGKRIEETGNPAGNQVDLSSLYSESAVLLDLDTGKIAAQKKGRERIYPASLTKMMTVLVVLENTEDLEQQVRLSEDIFPELYEEGASMAGFVPGEHASVRDLLYGAMLPSGGECCKALAEEVAGSEEKFAELMNDKAQELKMRDTHFTNSTGLPDKKHYTTTRDLARLLEYAWENGDFRAIFTTRSYTVPPTYGHPEGFSFYSLMFQEMEQSGVTSDYILGGKTGYTSEAGLCLASVGTVGDKTYALITAKADGSHDTQPYHILDAVSVFQKLNGE